LWSSINEQGEEKDADDGCWNPRLRKIMGAIATAGAVECGYLASTAKAGVLYRCLDEYSCSSVLNGPYAFIPGTEIPLSAVGLIAYSAVLVLSLQPLQLVSGRRTGRGDGDDLNRIGLVALTTTMGVFSVFLMTLLFGVLHQSCNYCLASAAFSIILAQLAWWGGALPAGERAKEGVGVAATGGFLSFLAALGIFLNVDAPANTNRMDTTWLAQQAPPQITTSSSKEALSLAKELKRLDASFYGAFWCSHCYDQKQTMGEQAMAMIPYIECDKDGVQSQSNLCREKKIPGYPTWEIRGQLYPGEQTLDELQVIVAKAKISP
jgi:uncharacterized membrane protein